MNIISPDLIERESVAEIFDIRADGAVICFDLFTGKGCRHSTGRGLIRDVIDQEIAQPLHQRHVAYPIFALNVPDDQRVENIGNIVVLRFLRLIEVRAGHTAFLNIPIKGDIRIRQFKIPHELAEGEGEDLNFKGTSGKQRCQVTAQQKSIGACDIDIVFLRSVKAVDSFLKAGTHLNFINEDEVVFVRKISVFNIVMQHMVLRQIFIRIQVEVHMNDIDLRLILPHIGHK